MPKHDFKEALNTDRVTAETENEFDAILLSSPSLQNGNKIVNLPLDKLVDYADDEFEKITGRPQPFHLYDKNDLQSLARSINEHGVMQPIIVRPMEDGNYQVVAGRNRKRASALCGYTEIPAIIKKDMLYLLMKIAH